MGKLFSSENFDMTCKTKSEPPGHQANRKAGSLLTHILVLYL